MSVGATGAPLAGCILRARREPACPSARRTSVRLYKALLGVASIAFLCLGASLALADDAPPAGPRAEWCKQNPEKCKELRAKREAFCKDNPQKCEQMKQKAAERQEFCKQNPEKCEQQRAAMKQRRSDLKAQCDADPAKCDEIKQQARERWKARHGMNPPANSPSQAE